VQFLGALPQRLMFEEMLRRHADQLVSAAPDDRLARIGLSTGGFHPECLGEFGSAEPFVDGGYEVTGIVACQGLALGCGLADV
jgi:hypothetical protein